MQKLEKRLLSARLAKLLMILATAFVFLFFLAFILMLTISSKDILSEKSLAELLFSSDWDFTKDAYGFAPAIVGTFVVTMLSMLFAVPVAVLGGIYLSEYARGKRRMLYQAFIDVLAGIPSVVFGICGLLVLVPFVRDILGPLFGVQTTGMCVLTASIVLGIMVLPVIVSITVESLSAIPIGLKEQFVSLGATKWQMIEKMMLKASGSGILSGIVLGFSRALGETIAVAMVIGNKSTMFDSLFSPAQTMPSVIINSFGEMMSIPMHRSALMLMSLILLIVVVFFNVLASAIKNKLRARWRYE